VGRSFDWLGAAWVEALRTIGIEGASWHDGPLLRSRWSDLVCFAGLGPGEVVVGGRKVVGISQRRTRSHARFQCVVLHRWDLAPLLDVVVTDPAARVEATADLERVAGGIGAVAPEAIVAALAEAVARG
jgi:lipoate-protein ligase A